MEDFLTKFALLTRIFVIVLQYLANILIPDHDADAFVSPQTTTNYTVIDKVVHHFFGGFVRWDAQYFMHIARYGYTYENTLAFFPLYPLTARLFASMIYSVIPFVSLDTVLLLVFVGLNVVLFVLCAKALFKLTTIIFNETVAYKSTLLFCINPASIFFSAPYSECMFFYLTLQTILGCTVLYKKYSAEKCTINYCDIIYILPLCLSLIVRSNGILNIGFLVYAYICVCRKMWPRNGFIRKTVFVVTSSFRICMLTMLCLVPFFIYQVYCYCMFCTNFDIDFPLNILVKAKENDFVLPGQFSKYNQAWCFDKMPLAYSFVQNHYWNVGLFKYYQLKQFPNFLLAAPILIILITESCKHIQNTSKNITSVFSFSRLFNKRENVKGTFDPVLNVFVIHILFLSLFCILFVHIQVSTRMLCSASPILYWYCASSFKNEKLDRLSDIFCKMSIKECVILTYFVGYFLVGTVLFCNFLPWT